MRPGYNTNGLMAHRWEQAIELMHEIGYRSVAITVDHSCLDPYSDRLSGELVRMERCLERFGMISCIESGARFVLDPRDKHQPTLVSADPKARAVRLEFLRRCIDIAHRLGSEAMSFWSGAQRDPAPRGEIFDRLVAGVRELLEYADRVGVRLAFEPEPGMFVASLGDYREMLTRIEGPGPGLCLDIGHVHCLETRPVHEHIREWCPRIFTIHIEDMVQGVHEHLRFGQGTIDFPPIFEALREGGYRGGLNVELSRHSHVAPEVLRESFEFLSRHLEAAPTRGADGPRQRPGEEHVGSASQTR